jgi:CHAT domain-containing protein
VPDGPLGNIPFAALRDPQTQRYLLQDFSVSISPSLSLTSLDPLGAPVGLIFGTDEAFLDFPALPAIAGELEQLGALYPQYPLRRNKAFTADSLATGIRDTPANIVHIACHGEFLGTAGDTFLVASDKRIYLNDLERSIRPKKYRSQPIELLCLSACRTAAGDDRAALGLAGAAVKSGSRSVLATLWYIEDASASETMVRFHKNLVGDRSRSKANALREAQLDFLREDPLAHPRFWAPYILIGNWK